MRIFNFYPSPVLLVDQDINKKKIASNDTYDKANKVKPNLTIDTTRDKRQDEIAYCAHKWSNYVSDEKDIKNPDLCDFTSTLPEEKETRPNKHPAVGGAFICNYCEALCCKNCHVEYPSSPLNDKGFLEKQNSLPENKASNIPENTHNNSSKSSLLDDFADTSTEMPDYTGGED